MRNRIYILPQFLLVFALQSLFTAAIAQEVNTSKDSMLYFMPFDTEGTMPTINHGDTAVSKIEKGHFVMDQKKANRYWALHFDVQADHPPFEVLEIKFKIVADSLPAMYGLLWNIKPTGPNKFDDCVFMLSTDKKFDIFAKKSGQDVPLSGWQPSFEVYSTGYNVLRIERRPENLYKFYINNELVYDKKLQPLELMFGGLYTDPHSMLSVDYVKLGVFKK